MLQVVGPVCHTGVRSETMLCVLQVVGHVCHAGVRSGSGMMPVLQVVANVCHTGDGTGLMPHVTCSGRVTLVSAMR